MAITPESPAFPKADAIPGIDQDVHAASDAHAYQRGSMAIQEQAATFSAFMAMAKWGSLWIASVLTFLTVWFMPGGSFFGGLIAMVVLLVAGWLFLKKPKSTH